MEEIKSIRVRDTEKYGFDYKISLFRDNNKRKIIVFNEEGDAQLISAPLKITEMTFGSKFKNYPDGVRVGSSNSNKFSGVIGNYLDQMVNLGYLSNTYRVIQDPWTNITPKERSFGFDYYYLNNGCRIQIEWIDGSGFVRGGDKWSDDEGNELNVTESGQDKSGIYKYAKIWIPYDSDEKPKVMTLYSGVFYDFNELRNDNETYDRWQRQFQNGNPKDNFIVKQIIDQWKINVPNYNLELCKPDNEGCSIIPYISPIESPPAVEPPVDNTPPPTEEQTQPVVEEPTIKPGVTFDVTKEGFFVNSEFGELRIVNPGLEGFDFGDLEESDLLSDEYLESEFSGQGELAAEISTRSELQNEPLPADTPDKTETLSVDFNDPKFVGGSWKGFSIDTVVDEINKTSHKPNSKFKESLKKILLWIKQDKDITDAREAAYLLGTAYAESGYSLQRWEADYVCSGAGIPYGSNGPCQKALNYFRSSKGKKNYYDLGTDSKGFPYFGRGLIQLTGKSNYKKYGEKIGVDLISNGDLALKEDNSYKIAVIYLTGRTFKHVRSNNLTQARKSVNGGTKGLTEVNGAYNDWLKIFQKYA